MKKCVTVWNYPGDPFENARRFHQMGFEAISWLGYHFNAMTEEEDERLVALLRETGMQLTVHTKLPDPSNAEECDVFKRAIRRAEAWQSKYGLLYSYTFDVWHDITPMLPYLNMVVETMRGLGTIIACEDFPLNAQQLKLLDKIVRPSDKFGMLLDAGHMNLRQYRMELVEPEDYVTSITSIPLPIIEVHLHDNMSHKDDHMYLGYGNLPLDAVVLGLKKKHFDGFATIEIIQHDWSEERTFAYAEESWKLFRGRWDTVDSLPTKCGPNYFL